MLSSKMSLLCPKPFKWLLVRVSGEYLLRAVLSTYTSDFTANYDAEILGMVLPNMYGYAICVHEASVLPAAGGWTKHAMQKPSRKPTRNILPSKSPN